MSAASPRVALRVAGRENGSWDFGFLPDEGVWTCDLWGSRTYLLYSVGVNGKDDGGKGYDDRKSGETWDDLVVRVPADKASKKAK
jgi:hypothetical protein